MYESYPWPGAYTIKDEMRLIAQWVKELFDGVIKEIEKRNKP